MIIYTKDSLFNQNGYLVHACNAQGVWGSGIAKEFKERFPNSFNEYRDFCINNKETEGKSLVTKDNVVCLITSRNYGKNVDSSNIILIYTEYALESFLKYYNNLDKKIPIYSNKFNSGLFNVPWKDTEKIIENLIDKYKVNWTICDPKLEV